MYRTLITSVIERGCQIRNILDIGANGGGFTLLAYFMGIPINQVVCVEMNPRVFGRLAFNLYQNLHNVSLVLINGAIAANSGSIEVSLGRGSTGETLHSNSVIAGNVDKIQLLSLDDIVNRAFTDNSVIDLCKIDVEGWEYEVFLGTECTLARRFRYLIMEIHAVPGKAKEELIMRLNALGFDDISPKERSERDVFLFQNRILSEI
jgi:FkbM family methyltransferase